MIIFLGAGVSRPIGIPTMPEFTKIFEKEIGENEIYKDIKNSTPIESFDLEFLMTILDDLSKPDPLETISPHTARFLIKKLDRERSIYFSDETKKKMLDLLSQSKKMIRKECLVRLKDNKSKLIEIYDNFFHKGFRSLLERSPKHVSGDGKLKYIPNTKIFTTNYDTCVETYLNYHQVEFSDGVVRRYGSNIFDVGSYLGEGSRVEFFKLHGSIDLFKKDGQIKQFTTASMPAGEVTSFGEEVGEEFLVYPIETSGVRYTTQSPFLELLYLFRKRLSEDRLWIIIGSSCRDFTICSIMNDVLRTQRDKEHPKIILIDPKPEEVLSNLERGDFSNLREQISSIKGKFGEDKTFEELENYVILAGIYF